MIHYLSSSSSYGLDSLRIHSKIEGKVGNYEWKNNQQYAADGTWSSVSSLGYGRRDCTYPQARAECAGRGAELPASVSGCGGQHLRSWIERLCLDLATSVPR